MSIFITAMINGASGDIHKLKVRYNNLKIIKQSISEGKEPDISDADSSKIDELIAEMESLDLNNE
jgi:hypothetical protein